MLINKFNTKNDQKLNISKKDFLNCFDDIKVYKYKDISYWIIFDKNKEFVIYEKNNILYIQKKYGSKKYNDSNIKNCKVSESENESESESESEFESESESESESKKSKDCNDLFKNIKNNNKILCLEKLLRYLKYVQISNGKKKLNFNISTFEDLEAHLGNDNYDTIHDFMKKFSLEFQQKFEPLESVFRLFCSKGLVKIYDKSGNNILLNSFISTNNFGRGEVTINSNQNIILTDKLKDSGDISDLTFVNKELSTIYVCSSKNYKDYSSKGKKFDLEKIHAVYNNYYKDKFKNIVTIIIVRSKSDVLNAIKNMSFSSRDSKNLLKNSIFVDFDDINEAYRKFKYGTDNHIHMCYYNELKINKNNIILYDKNGIPRIFKGSIQWSLEDEKNCKLANIDPILKKKNIKDIIKRFSINEIVNYYKNFSDIYSIWIENSDPISYIKSIFGETVIVNETLNIKNQEDKNNLYNVLNNFCVLNNSKEDLSILVIVDDNESNYNIDNYKKYKIIMKNDVDTIKLDDYNVLINLSNDTINTIIHKFLTINSDKSYNFIVDKDKNRLEYTNNKFCIKDFMAFKISSKNQYSYLNPL